MKKCFKCDQSFIVTNDRTKFCSHSCQAKWAITKAFENRTPRKKTGDYLKCIICNKEFYVPLYRLKNPKTKYCSRPCLAKEHLKKYFPIYGFKKLNKPPHKYKTIRINGKTVREH